jgi:hypothetical protein
MLPQSRIGIFRHPQGTLLISQQVSWEIGSRDIAKLAALFLMQIKTPNPKPLDGQWSIVRDIATRDVNLLNFQTLSTEVPIP